MSDIPDNCSMCDKPPIAGVNGAAYCAEHVDDGFAAVGRAMAIAEGITDERRIVAMERAMVDAYHKADAIPDIEVGATVHINTGRYGDDVN